MDWIIILLGASAFASQIGLSSGIMCYECTYISGSTDPDCLHPSEQLLVNCSTKIPINTQDITITSWDYCETAIGCRVHSQALMTYRPALHRTCSPGVTQISVNPVVIPNVNGNKSVIIEHIPEGFNSDGIKIRNFTIWMCKSDKCNSGIPLALNDSSYQSEALKTVCSGYAKLGHLTIFLVLPFFMLLPSGFS